MDVAPELSDRRALPDVGRIRTLPRSLIVGIALTAAVAAIALLGPHVLAGNPTELNLKETLGPPSLLHPLGTDNFGRDVMTRIIHAASVDLQFGLFSVLPTFLTGTLLGLWAGTHRRFDIVLMRVLDLVVAFPFYVVIIAVVAALGPGVQNMYVAVMVFGWASFARVVRNEVLVVTRLDYVAAATVLGFPSWRVVRRHVLPNVIIQPVVLATTNFIAYILLGSSLGFLGLGVQPPAPEWGVMIAEGRDFLAQAPWISVFPGIAILIVSTSFVFLGDGLADFLRPEVSRQ